MGFIKIAINHLIFIAALLLSGCTWLIQSDPTTLIKNVSNHSKTKKAILFIKEGNATVSQSLQVSIKDVKDNLHETEVGNTFTADDDHGKMVLRSTAIKLHWKDDHHLMIRYDGRLRTFIKNTAVDNVTIIYHCF